MTIILKENEWAKQMIDSSSLGKKPAETLRRVSRYYIDQGFSADDARKKTELFLLQCDHTASIAKWSPTLDNAVRYAQRYPAVDIEKIVITDEEMKIVDALPGKQIRRLAFTLLCLAKYHTVVWSDFDYWVNDKDSDVMNMADIHTSIKRQCLMYKELRDMGLITFSKKVDNTSVRVNFVSGEAPALYIDDFRNLGYQYIMFHGGPYFKCSNCGITTQISNPGVGRPQKYCKQCASEISTAQKVNYAMRQKKEKKEKKIAA